jgi:SRSO17 transposase
MTKPQIALMQIGAAREAGVAQGVVLMDASYGTNAALRFGIAALGLTYAAAILPTVKVCAIAEPQKRVSVKTVALGLPKHTWRSIIWREGSAEKLTSRFARVRVRTAPIRAAAGRPEETGQACGRRTEKSQIVMSENGNWMVVPRHRGAR